MISSTLAITPHSRPHRLAVPRTPARLLSCRSPTVTCEKSLATTAPCAPTPTRRRKSGAACRTKPLAARRSGSLPCAGERRAQPARTRSTAQGQFSGSPSPTSAAVSRTPGAIEPPEKWPLSASACPRSGSTRGRWSVPVRSRGSRRDPPGHRCSGALATSAPLDALRRRPLYS